MVQKQVKKPILQSLISRKPKWSNGSIQPTAHNAFGSTWDQFPSCVFVVQPFYVSTAAMQFPFQHLESSSASIFNVLPHSTRVLSSPQLRFHSSRFFSKPFSAVLATVLLASSFILRPFWRFCSNMFSSSYSCRTSQAVLPITAQFLP